MLGIVINLLICFCYQTPFVPHANEYYTAIFILGIVDVGLTCMLIFTNGISQGPLHYLCSLRSVRARIITGQLSFTDHIAVLALAARRVIKDDLIWFITYGIFGLLGLVVNPLFFMFQLSFILRIPLLKGVVSAIWTRKAVLMLTFLLLILIFYFFSLFGFLFFYEDYPNKRCTYLYECVIATFD